jgi:N-hydroxyarylamine O-acetyltransferase
MSSSLPASAVALAPYLERIDYTGGLAPTLATLTALHLAHATHIPFENIDVLLGRGIDLSPHALERKLVTNRRGGYCFEHNLLFASVLETLGFDVTLLSARVRFGAPAGSARPRTHMALLVSFTDGTRWLADVGFGGEGLLHPVCFEPASESSQPLGRYRIAPDGTMPGRRSAGGGGWVLQAAKPEGWVDLYVFSLDAHERVDYEVLNHYTATHPRSIFRSLLIAQRASTDGRVTLRNRELTITRGDRTTTRVVTDGEMNDVLRDHFGIELGEGGHLSVPE